MSVDRREHVGRVRAVRTSTIHRTRSALILHGPGNEPRLGAIELADVLEATGWTTSVERANPSDPHPQKHVELVIGVNADIAAFRAAAHSGAAVVTANNGDRALVTRNLTAGDELVIRTSPIGIAWVDHDPPTPIVHRAIVTAVEPDAELAWTAPIGQQLALDRIVSVAVDIPEPIHGGPGSRSRSTAVGAVMTFRSAQDSSSVLLHPDDDYTITAADGSDIVVHIDQCIHQTGRRVHLNAHPVGLRIVDDPTGRPA